MGNECQKLCCQNTDLKLGVLSSNNYDKLVHSKLVQDEFPEDLVPETVREKIKLLNVQFDLNNSQIWKYEDTETKPQDPSYVVYTIVSKQSVSKKSIPQVHQEQNIIANKSVPSTESNVQKKRSFNPDNFENAAIFIFKSQKTDISNHSINSKQNPYKQNLVLEKVYYGPITQTMHAPEATVILQNGQYYRGNTHQFKLDGKGIMKNALGNHQYEGSWQNNQPHGQGTQSLAGIFSYTGDFSHGKWQGKGTITFMNNINQYSIEGNFNQGILQGSGKVFNLSNELVYDGPFKNGKQHGRGKWYNNSNGELYEGEFAEGRKQGFGKYTFRSGIRYEGMFKDGKPQGEGELIEGNRRTKGYWYKGENVVTYNQE